MNRLNKIGHLEIIRYTDYKDFSLGLKEYKDLELRTQKARKFLCTNHTLKYTKI